MSSKIIKSNSLIGTFGVMIMVLGAALFTAGLMSQTIYIANYGGISTFFFGFFSLSVWYDYNSPRFDCWLVACHRGTGCTR